MIRVDVKNLAGEVKFGGRFESEVLADAWISATGPTGQWGKPDRWVLEEAATEEDLARATETRQVETAGGVKTECHIPADFTVEKVDITAEATLEAALALRQQKEEIGDRVIRMVQVINGQKNLSLAEYQAMLTDPTLNLIKELLRTGALAEAKGLMQSYDSVLFTDQDKATLIKVIDDSGLV